jgi:dihydrofolate reductase
LETSRPRKPRLTLIAALAANRVIGRGNELPWHLPEDLRRFKALTLGHPVIMGRKTFESILARLKKPLPGRRNLVISRSLTSVPEGAELFGSLGSALAACQTTDEVFVIGGEQIYNLALPLADCLRLTEIASEVEGDAYFPEFDRAEFVQTTRQAGENQTELKYDFVTYQRHPS